MSTLYKSKVRHSNLFENEQKTLNSYKIHQKKMCYKHLDIKIFLTCLVMASVNDKNVIETSKLSAQLVEVASEFPKLRAHKG